VARRRAGRHRLGLRFHSEIRRRSDLELTDSRCTHPFDYVPRSPGRGPFSAAHNVGVINEDEARELVRRALDRASEYFVITDAKRISSTWVVSYNSRKYVETGDLRYFETGPGPILVSDDGRLMRAPTGRPTRPSGSMTLAECIAEFEQQKM